MWGGGRGVRLCSEHAPPGSSRRGGSCWSPAAEAAAAAARDSMRGPLGKSWQLCVRLTPLASHGPHLSLPRAPPTSLARTLLGPCLGVKGRPRRGWQPGPTSRGLRSPFRCPARGGGQGGVGSRGARVSRGPLSRPVPRSGGPSIPGLTAPVPTTPWPAGPAVGHREWPRPLGSPPGPATAGEWLAVR